MSLLNPEVFYVLGGLVLAAMAVHIARDASHPRRLGSVIFWGLLALTFAGGRLLSPFWVGCAMLVMAVLAAARQVQPPQRHARPSAEREEDAARHGDRLLIPTLLLPALVLVGGFTLDRIHVGAWSLAAPQQVALTAIGLACLVSLFVALRLTRSRPALALREGTQLLQVMGWALLLPQLLASLGGIFAQAGVGEVIARLVADLLPVQQPLVAVITYCAGMAIFTMLMGNAFAAFPVITLGVGLPFIVQAHGGNPAIMGALGMLCGYCGTLVTPMAANFNIVPAVLLELEDRHAIIRAQAPMAAAIWIFNVALMNFCVYRF